MATLMPVRFPVAVLVALLCAALPASAAAQHHPHDWWQQQQQQLPPQQEPDDGTWPPDPGVEQAPPATTPTPPVAVPTPVPAPAPRPELPILETIAPTKMVPGTVAKLRTDGKAAIPRGAPKRVRALIAAANRIVGKPYKWGGGHARVADSGYDCSGTVSFALMGGGLLAFPMVSGSFSKWEQAGPGKWVTTYSTRNHVYMEVAGLRLDTSPVADPRGGNGPRWRPLIGARGGFHVRHPLGL